MKKYEYKKSCLIIFIFYEMLEKQKEFSIKDLQDNFGISRSTAYTFMMDIDLFIGEFYLDPELELVNVKKNIG